MFSPCFSNISTSTSTHILCLHCCYPRSCVANWTNGNDSKLPLSKPKKTENVIISEARSCIIELELTSRGENAKAVDTKMPLLTAKSIWIDTEKKSFRTTILLFLPVVVLQMRKTNKNPIRSTAPKTSFWDKCLIRSIGMQPDKSLPSRSPVLNKTKLRGT